MADTIDAAFVWKTIKAQPIAMFTTEEEGKLVSRPMASYVRPEEGRIYFLTRLDKKTDAVGRSAPVNLGYADNKRNSWVSLSGTASTSQNRSKIRDLWSTEAEAWLPDGPDGADTALITVQPEDATVWDSTSSRIVYAAKALAALVTQTPPDPGRVEHVTL